MLLVVLGHIWLFFAILRRISLLLRVVDIWNLRFAVVLMYLLSGGMPNWFANNFLECLLSLFALFATYASLRALMEYNYQKWLWYVLMGLAVFLGYLTKGPVALFTIAFPFIWGCLIRQKLWGIVQSLLVLFVAVFAMGVLLLNSTSAWEFMKAYHKLQVLPAVLSNVDPNIQQPPGRTANAGDYWERIWLICRNIFLQILLPLGIFVFFYVRHFLLKHRYLFVWGDMVYKKVLAFFLLASFAASVPIILSPSIYPNYFMPSHTLYVLFFSLLLLPFIRDLKLPKPNLWRKLSLVSCLILGIFCYAFYGKISRYSEIIELAEQVKKDVPKYSVVYVDENHIKAVYPRYADIHLFQYDPAFMRYSYSILKKLSEIKYDTPSYLLLHSSYLENYTDVLKVYSLVAKYNHGFQLYQYVGS